MRYRSVSVFALAALLGACNTSLPRGQFGPYPRQPDQLRLPGGQVLPVYRMKLWTFSDGEPPAIQLEYEPPFSVSDTAAVHREARTVWPYFVRYLEANGLTGGIVTATNLRVSGLWPIAWTSHEQSFGFVASRGSDGRWRFKGDTVPLPPADQADEPRITDPHGQPLAFSLPRPAG